MQEICIGSTGWGAETGARPGGQGNKESTQAESILAESRPIGTEHASHSPCMLLRSNAGLVIPKIWAGTASIRPGVWFGKEDCWLRSRAFFCMFLGYIAHTMLYVNLVDTSALSLESYPRHEGDSVAETQRLQGRGSAHSASLSSLRHDV